MAAVRKLTDAELRQALKSFGESPGPINNNTRTLYIRKLNKLKGFEIPNKKKLLGSTATKSKTSHSKPLGFSSDDSENEVADTVRRKKSQSVSAIRTRSTRKTAVPVDEQRKDDISRSTRQNRPSTPKITNGYSDDSDDSNDSRGSWVQISTAVTNTSPGLFAADSPNNSGVKKRRPLRSDARSIPLPLSESPGLGVNQANSRSNSFNHDQTPSKEIKNGGSALQRRVLNRAIFHKSSEKETPSESCKNEDNNANNSILSKSWLKRKRSPAAAAEPEESPSRLWPLHCAMLIPICIVGFFIILGLLYVTMRSDEVINNIDLPKFPASAGDVELNERSLNKALQLIKDHSEWLIFLYKDRESTPLLSDESVAKVAFLETSTPILPTMCRFQRAIYKVLFRVLLTLTVIVLVRLALLYMQYRTRKSREDRQAMFIMVEKILDVLRRNYESSLDDETIEPYIPIVIVRDMIIPVQERRKKMRIWEMAVRFLSASESRIRLETQRVLGEDYRVWRWIQVSSPGKRNQSPKRRWQGVAFGPNCSINTPNISPTPCLKIRDMFDPDTETDENWDVQVRDSILEKCSDNNEILSIVVEKKSKEGLVYVKCASCAGAGKVFRSLHGAWFDGRLVTVKFIKLQRYHIRYPHTVDHITPLKPSSPVPVSTFVPQDDAPGFSTSTPAKDSN